jgi:metal-dependent amidase/aminoacylase/carboxypeptidase family protein
MRKGVEVVEYGYLVFHDASGIGGTGVVGVLANGSGPVVLLRCELDALPLREATGAAYASTATARDASGHEVPADHACGHDMHMACMTGMATLMAAHRDRWNGTLITLFQPAEETGEGAQEMAVKRIVRAECEASGSPKGPDFETIFSFPVTDNDAAATGRVAQAFTAHFGDRATEIPKQTVSEDFSKIPDAVSVPYCYWALGFTDRDTYLAAERDGHLEDLPTSHSPKFLPPLQPTLRTGTEALTTAALGWLAP